MGTDAKAAPETILQLRVGDPSALSKCEDPEVSSGPPGERVLLQIAEQGGTRDGICGKSAGHRGGLPLGVHVITKPILLIRIDNRPIEHRTRYRYLCYSTHRGAEYGTRTITRTDIETGADNGTLGTRTGYCNPYKMTKLPG